MQSWLPSLAAGTGPKYAAIADAIIGAIHAGELRPGERLPSQRALATRLAVDLTTVTRAYGLVAQAGLIEGAGKLGSFVRNDALPPLVGETTSEMGMNVPPQPGFGLLAEAIRSGTAALLRAGRHSPILQYQPSIGSILERSAAAEALAGRGIAAHPDEIVITAGSQSALHAIAATHLSAGDAICCAHFLYPGMRKLAARTGLVLRPVAVDAEGMLPDALDRAIAGGTAAIYLTPTNDNPTTTTMGPERRQAIAAIARRHGTTIIEDDAYGLLPARPLAPIAGLVPELTWHIGGTSKIISPMLRVAHVKAPSARHAAALAQDLHETTVMAPPLNAALVTLWLREGTFGSLVAGVRAEGMARQRIAARCLSGIAFAAHPEGYHLWVSLPPGAAAEAIVARGVSLGLSIVPGSAFAVEAGAGGDTVRISIGGPIDHARLERALKSVAGALRE